jgi:hypothetical protein
MMQWPLARAPRDAIRRLNCCDNDTECSQTGVANYAAPRAGVGMKEETLDARNLTCLLVNRISQTRRRLIVEFRV